MQNKISYNAQVGCARLDDYCHKVKTKCQDMTEINKMEGKEISWDEACASQGGSKYLKLDTGVRKTVVAKNPRFEEVEVTFQGKTSNKIQLTLDVIEVDNEEVEMTWNTVSKRLKDALRPLYENVPEETEVCLSIKKIGKDTDTNYDVEKL